MALDEAKRNFRYVGTRPNRPDGVDKVTGRAQYGADMTAPGMLTAAILRSARMRMHGSSRLTPRPPRRWPACARW